MGRRSASTDAPPVPDDLRCRRSNGKDWRCAELALPELSYCGYHHHLNYHRPPSDRPSVAGKISDPIISRPNRPSKPKRKRDLVNSQNVPFQQMPQPPVPRRRKKRRRGDACEPEPGFSNLSSRSLLPQLTGEDVCPLNQIYDALPVRFRPANGTSSSLSNLLTNGEEIDIYDTMPIQVSVPGPVPEEMRCRRSNGKEWRCTEQTLPGLSYCAYHHNLNYNRTGTKQPKGTSRTSRTNKSANIERESNKVLCKRTNGKGWQCPNQAIEGLSYCPYHHQLNYRGANSNTNSESEACTSRTIGTSGIIGLDGLLVKRQKKRKHGLFDDLHYAI